MSARLLPCPGCDRHIRITDSLCPFCAAPLPLSYQSAGPAPLPRKRLSRAAKFAFGATLAGAVSLTGCGDDGTTTDTGMTTDTGTTMDSGAMPPYGTPPMDSGFPDASPPDGGDGDAAPDGGGDAAPDGGGGDAAADASTPDSGPAPAYGAPPEA